MPGKADKRAASASVRYIDLFCGIGGFRYAVEHAARTTRQPTRCVLSCDIDPACRQAYAANFAETPSGDISAIATGTLPDHDLLLAGFPCQPFSIMGLRRGFEDARGTLFFEIARLLQTKQPQAFVLENVKLLAGHNQGRTLSRIVDILRELGYTLHWRVLNALDFGLPQKRERIFIAGFKNGTDFKWPSGGVPMTPLREVLESTVGPEHWASDYIRARRQQRLTQEPSQNPVIWHENKSGHVSAHPYACALRAGASYNYQLVNGERRLTPREQLRLQGFPEHFKTVCTPAQTRKQTGNSLPVPVATAVLIQVFIACGWSLQPRKARLKTLPQT